MKIIADENLALTDYFFSDIADVTSCAGRTLSHQQVKSADALVVRSVTPINRKLLDDTAVKFVGSATIGTDHMDLNYLNDQHIGWSNAAGCNAQAVAEYVITALYQVKPECLEKSFTLGIVGLGNVGSKLKQLAHNLGWNVIGYDPFLQNFDWERLIKESDAISIHVPLTKTGDYPTYHLFDQHVFDQMSPHTILINSARGSVIAEEALLKNIQETNRTVVLDVFEHEPKISQAVLDAVKLVTPHIAGYSLEGKARGTQMIYQSLCSNFGLISNKDFRTQLPPCTQYFKTNLKQTLVLHIQKIYNIAEDDKRLRDCVKDGYIHQIEFDQLRKNYPLRREWASHGAIL